MVAKRHLHWNRHKNFCFTFFCFNTNKLVSEKKFITLGRWRALVESRVNAYPPHFIALVVSRGDHSHMSGYYQKMMIVRDRKEIFEKFGMFGQAYYDA